jgi:hypothetical protein
MVSIWIVVPLSFRISHLPPTIGDPGPSRRRRHGGGTSIYRVLGCLNNLFWPMRDRAALQSPMKACGRCLGFGTQL